MPNASSLGYPSVDYTADLTLPSKATSPAQGSGVQIGFTRYAWGGASDATWDPTPGSFSGGGEASMRTQSGAACITLDGVAGTGNAGFGVRVPMYRPQLDPASSPEPDDPSMRILWVKLWMLEDPANADPAIADSLGFNILADNGLAFSSATWPVAANGGFGIFRRVGNDGYRWASYSAAPALLESTNLATGTGWHSADIIIRQAAFGDVSTPWLTLRWDETDIITERPFGHASLPTPETLRAGAHGWAFLPCLFPTDTGRMGMKVRIRIGRFHPDGYPQP